MGHEVVFLSYNMQHGLGNMQHVLGNSQHGLRNIPALNFVFGTLGFSLEDLNQAPFKCKDCDKEFIMKKSLRVHLKSNHIK
jgi:hypothetical protein